MSESMTVWLFDAASRRRQPTLVNRIELLYTNDSDRRTIRGSYRRLRRSGVPARRARQDMFELLTVGCHSVWTSAKESLRYGPREDRKPAS